MVVGVVVSQNGMNLNSKEVRLIMLQKILNTISNLCWIGKHFLPQNVSLWDPWDTILHIFGIASHLDLERIYEGKGSSLASNTFEMNVVVFKTFKISCIALEFPLWRQHIENSPVTYHERRQHISAFKSCYFHHLLAIVEWRHGIQWS